MQAQSEAEEEAEGESELDGQLLQEVSEALYLPAIQTLQVTPPRRCCQCSRTGTYTH